MQSQFRHALVTGLAAAALLTAIPALAQSSGSEFTPHVGQAGKDVIWVPTPRSLVMKMLKMADVKPGDIVV